MEEEIKALQKVYNERSAELERKEAFLQERLDARKAAFAIRKSKFQVLCDQELKLKQVLFKLKEDLAASTQEYEVMKDMYVDIKVQEAKMEANQQYHLMNTRVAVEMDLESALDEEAIISRRRQDLSGMLDSYRSTKLDVQKIQRDLKQDLNHTKQATQDAIRYMKKSISTVKSVLRDTKSKPSFSLAQQFKEANSALLKVLMNEREAAGETIQHALLTIIRRERLAKERQDAQKDAKSNGSRMFGDPDVSDYRALDRILEAGLEAHVKSAGVVPAAVTAAANAAAQAVLYRSRKVRMREEAALQFSALPPPGTKRATFLGGARQSFVSGGGPSRHTSMINMPGRKSIARPVQPNGGTLEAPSRHTSLAMANSSSTLLSSSWTSGSQSIEDVSRARKSFSTAFGSTTSTIPNFLKQENDTPPPTEVNRDALNSSKRFVSEKSKHLNATLNIADETISKIEDICVSFNAASLETDEPMKTTDKNLFISQSVPFLKSICELEGVTARMEIQKEMLQTEVMQLGSLLTLMRRDLLHNYGLAETDSHRSGNSRGGTSADSKQRPKFNIQLASAATIDSVSKAAEIESSGTRSGRGKKSKKGKGAARLTAIVECNDSNLTDEQQETLQQSLQMVSDSMRYESGLNNCLDRLYSSVLPLSYATRAAEQGVDDQGPETGGTSSSFDKFTPFSFPIPSSSVSEDVDYEQDDQLSAKVFSEQLSQCMEKVKDMAFLSDLDIDADQTNDDSTTDGDSTRFNQLISLGRRNLPVALSLDSILNGSDVHVHETAVQSDPRVGENGFDL